jgi:hypothetical protein
MASSGLPPDSGAATATTPIARVLLLKRGAGLLLLATWRLAQLNAGQAWAASAAAAAMGGGWGVPRRAASLARGRGRNKARGWCVCWWRVCAGWGVW